jgi:hypothetical protein
MNVDQFSDVIAVTSFPGVLLKNEHSKIGPRDHVLYLFQWWGETVCVTPTYSSARVIQGHGVLLDDSRQEKNRNSVKTRMLVCPPQIPHSVP